MISARKLLLALCIFIFIGCHKTYHIPENEILGGWKVGETGYVKHNGIDVTKEFSSYYVGFYYPKYFVFSRIDSLHSHDGEWTWMGSGLKQLSIDNGKVLVNKEELTKTSLHATLKLSQEYVETLGIGSAYEGDYEILLHR